MNIDEQIKALQAVKFILEAPQEWVDSIDDETKQKLLKRLQRSIEFDIDKCEEKQSVNPKAKYRVGQYVRISSAIGHDQGYSGSLGIVTKTTWINRNYYYVIAYDTRASRYWVCGFTEDELYGTEKTSKELRQEYIKYMKANTF